MSVLFLLGGGIEESQYIRTYWRFIRAATVNKERSIAIVIAEQPDMDKARREAFYRSAFELFPVTAQQCHVLFASPDDPLSAARLEALQPTGVFVAGGRTPCYHDALCADRSWLDYTLARGLPYAGFSAGAVVLAEQAVMGGTRVALLHSNADVAPADAGEGLEFLQVRAGLGLVPFAVEAHATQWGTLSRLAHAVGEGLVPRGWAIDEGCMLEIEGDELRVFGANNAYRVRRLGERSTQVDVFRAGTVLSRAAW
jgi:cyanophycinase